MPLIVGNNDREGWRATLEPGARRPTGTSRPSSVRAARWNGYP